MILLIAITSSSDRAFLLRILSHCSFFSGNFFCRISVYILLKSGWEIFFFILSVIYFTVFFSPSVEGRFRNSVFLYNLRHCFFLSLYKLNNKIDHFPCINAFSEIGKQRFLFCLFIYFGRRSVEYKMLRVYPEEIILQKLAPSHKDVAVYTLGLVHFFYFIFCCFQKFTDPFEISPGIIDAGLYDTSYVYFFVVKFHPFSIICENKNGV